jgi:cysteine-S-conjugate beta-lyase
MRKFADNSLRMNYQFDDITPAFLQQKRGSKWTTYPSDVLAAWVAEGDLSTAPAIRQVLTQMTTHDDFGYPTLTDRTLQVLREVFSARALTRFNWSIAPENIDILTDVMQGAYIAMHTLTKPGDGIIVQTPIYPPFMGSVREMQRTLLINPLVQNASSNYEIDFADLEKHANARMLFLCNPHNPSGRVFTRTELEKIAAIVLRNDWIIVSDEIHADIVFPGSQHIPIASLSPEIAARTITLTSATKAFSIPGLRCAIAAFGSTQLRDAFRQIPQGMRGGHASFGLQATIAAWRNSDAWLNEAVQYLDGNRKLVAAFAQKYLPHGKHPQVQGTYLAWLDCSGLQLPTNGYDFFLEKARVALSPGEIFGDARFVRLNFATPRPILEEILGRMADAIRTL